MYADLAKLLAQELKVRPASGPRCVSADRVIILEKKEMVAFLAVVEMKNEIGSGNCDPAAQASFAYAFYMAQPEMQQLLATSNCPCFLIAVAGPHIRILGAVFTDYVIVKPLTDWMQLDIDPADNAQLDRFARVLLALRTSLQSLAEHYQALKLGNTDTTFTRFFPHIRSYPVSDNGFVSFHYLEKLASSSLTKPVFKALTDKKEFIVVKFTQQYNTDAHRLLATNGLAPNLLYSGFDTGNTHGSCGSLKMVVMEFAEGKTAYDHDKELSVKQYEHVQNAVKILHDEGFVFGDLRLPNIMVDGETAKLIDFDWCAKEGTGRYPAVINDSDITWHTGVKRGGKMEKEHDDFMLLEDNMPHLLQ
ncbi:hypothetical protein FIBSPDRAFT_813265 [Athelia psychrophila]|uniref:Protein kinase domain-containing protein n=1 Tax=Athelia psychrophila TaxID=1759441 RepID=A0A166UH44_9AGAM|nr:hypothetical protein FIBSPDRAFT_813265 [Fibularhizoctonia sp. CBS 109695]